MIGLALVVVTVRRPLPEAARGQTTTRSADIGCAFDDFGFRGLGQPIRARLRMVDMADERGHRRTEIQDAFPARWRRRRRRRFGAISAVQLEEDTARWIELADAGSQLALAAARGDVGTLTSNRHVRSSAPCSMSRKPKRDFSNQLTRT